ncbi:MAG: M20/M25/M40 family metallo-hydrolase [Candidatus Heimdallarchaeota archaeon]|nr:M20/M25/M40 family metallo-hydrolase [Candidatus Heimdallarchaeota archaeon]MCK5048984.1 M20/M25/M40 family metallo-hydrolase [Candidatus Heimdallarchaeota archaeon]
MADIIDEIVPLLRELIKNKCVNPPGDEMRSIKTLERYFSDKNVPTKVFESTPERGNIVARLKGSDPKAPSLMFGPSHVDVVPVENEENWTVDPFGGELKDNCIWGRGAVDMLATVACQAVVFAKLYHEFKPKGDLVYLAVADEEAGGFHGAKWIVDNHFEEIKADYSITETGGIPIQPNKYVVMVGEKGTIWLTLKFKGEEGHGSAPFKASNAILKMSEAVQRLENYKAKVDTTYIKQLMDGLGGSKISKLLATNKVTLPFILNKLVKSGELGTAKSLHALSRMTISPNICTGGTKTNVIAGSAELTLDVRALPGQDLDYIMNELKKALGSMSEEVEITVLAPEEGGWSFMEGSVSPIDNSFFEAMEKALQKFNPEAKIVPMLLSGGTDGRFLREKGIESYCFGMFDDELSFETIGKSVHGDNERISLGTLKLTVGAFEELARNFLA